MRYRRILIFLLADDAGFADFSEHMQAYLADVYSLDEDIGRLLKRLEELGLNKNTIVTYRG